MEPSWFGCALNKRGKLTMDFWSQKLKDGIAQSVPAVTAENSDPHRRSRLQRMKPKSRREELKAILQMAV